MKRGLSGTSLSSENYLLTFQLNAPVIIRTKVKRCKQTLLFIAMQYSGYMSLEVIGRWWLLPPCLLITVVQQLQELQSSISVEVVLWGCNLDDCPGPPSPTVPVLCHGLALWSPPSRSGGDSPTHACTAAADVFIIPHLPKILYRSWPSPLPRWRVFFFELFCFVCLFLFFVQKWWTCLDLEQHQSCTIQKWILLICRHIVHWAIPFNN